MGKYGGVETALPRGFRAWPNELAASDGVPIEGSRLDRPR